MTSPPTAAVGSRALPPSPIHRIQNNCHRESRRAGGNSGYAWWFGRLWVDPKNENHVFNADVSLRESTDGGATWHVSAGVHADQHVRNARSVALAQMPLNSRQHLVQVERLGDVPHRPT